MQVQLSTCPCKQVFPFSHHTNGKSSLLLLLLLFLFLFQLKSNWKPWRAEVCWKLSVLLLLFIFLSMFLFLLQLLLYTIPECTSPCNNIFPSLSMQQILFLLTAYIPHYSCWSSQKSPQCHDCKLDFFIHNKNVPRPTIGMCGCSVEKYHSHATHHTIQK